MQALSFVFCDDNDLTYEVPEITDTSHLAGKTSHILTHVAVRNEILQSLNNKDYKKTNPTTGLKEDLTCWDILDLHPIEEGLAYSRLIEEFKLTQQQVADKVGKDRATIANLLRVLQLPKEIRELVREQKISVGHAKVLLGVNSVADMIELANKIPLQNMSVRQCEKAVANLNLKNSELNKHHDSDLDLRKKMVGSVEDQLQKKLGTKVQIDYNSGKGKISIQFYSDAEFNQLVEKLKE